jgi:hypothetical protein
MDFAAFRSFWETSVNIASFTTTPTLQHGYGMNAIEDDPSAASLTNAVSNFGAAYATTQESQCNNNAYINAMQGQIQMLCNALGTQPPAGMLQYPQQTNQGCQAQGGQCGQQQTKSNKDNPAVAVVAPTTAADGLYRGNGNGSGHNQGSSMTFNGGDGSYPSQGTSNPPSPIKKFNNWNFCYTHGGNVHNNHTSTTCAQPGVHHQYAATRSNTISDNNKGLHKTIPPGTTG